MAKKGIRDLILFFVFAGVPIVSFWLQDYPDTPFFASMLVVFLIVLMWLRQYHGEEEYRKLLITTKICMLKVSCGLPLA